MSTVVKITLSNGSYLYLLDSHFGSFDLQIDVLTLKMIWNHENNTINRFSESKVHEKEALHLFLGKLVGNIIYDLENHIFAYLTWTFTFWPWGWPLIIKIVPLNLILQSKTHQKEVLNLLLFAFVKNNISQFWP